MRLTEPNQPAPVACVRTGLLTGVYGEGVCGDPATQTCSKKGYGGSSRTPTTHKLLFSDYEARITDGSGNVYPPCTDAELQCCDGNLWGDVVPVGECCVPTVVCRWRARWLWHDCTAVPHTTSSKTRHRLARRRRSVQTAPCNAGHDVHTGVTQPRALFLSHSRHRAVCHTI